MNKPLTIDEIVVGEMYICRLSSLVMLAETGHMITETQTGTIMVPSGDKIMKYYNRVSGLFESCGISDYQFINKPQAIAGNYLI